MALRFLDYHDGGRLLRRTLSCDREIEILSMSTEPKVLSIKRESCMSGKACRQNFMRLNQSEGSVLRSSKKNKNRLRFKTGISQRPKSQR